MLVKLPLIAYTYFICTDHLRRTIVRSETTAHTEQHVLRTEQRR